jgi:hypothetical protein
MTRCFPELDEAVAAEEVNLFILAADFFVLSQKWK